MNLFPSAALALLLLVATLGIVAAWSGAAGHLAGARLGLVLAAGALQAVGFLVFSGIWALLAVTVNCDGRVAAVDTDRRFGRRFRVGILSLAGLLTPLNVGSDILRSILGKHYLGLEYPPTAAASIVTRECKLHVSLALLGAITVAGISMEASGARMLALAGALSGLALLFAVFRSSAAARVTRVLGIAHLASATSAMSRQLRWTARGAIYLLFAASFAAEWQALRLCFRALDAPADLAVTLAGYGVLHFLSRAPVLPLGIGAVELAGFAWFRAVHVPGEQAGAIVILWSCLRVVVPYSLAAASFITFVARRRRQSSGRPPGRALN
jgi:hypothetical protein